MTQRKNPIARRLDLLSDQWTEFAELPEARLLCWRLHGDELPLLEAFIATESDAEAGSLPDLFVRLSSAFDAAQPYGFALCAEFTAQAKLLEAGLDEQPPKPWSPPSHRRGETDVALWVRTCASFIEHFALPGHLAAWLSPGEVSDVMAMQLWLQRVSADAPPNLRFIVVDSAEAPALEPLVRAAPLRVVAQTAALDMPAARLEISQEAGGLDTAGGKFRHLFVKLSNALGAGNLPEAHVHAQAALGIAAEQRWFALAVPVHFALGAALAGAARPEEANERYLSAEIAASEGEKAGDPVCARLRVQARLARGGLLVGARAYRPAATLFVETLPMARALSDARLILDCYRLAAFSYEQDAQHEPAWRYGTEGLNYARELDRETLETSTFAYLGEGLMRLSQRGEYAGTGLRIEREIVGLLGKREWRPSSARPAAAASQPMGAAE